MSEDKCWVVRRAEQADFLPSERWQRCFWSTGARGCQFCQRRVRWAATGWKGSKKLGVLSWGCPDLFLSRALRSLRKAFGRCVGAGLLSGPAGNPYANNRHADVLNEAWARCRTGAAGMSWALGGGRPGLFKTSRGLQMKPEPYGSLRAATDSWCEFGESPRAQLWRIARLT